MVHDPRDPDMRLVLFSEEASTAPELPAAALTLLEEMAGEAVARYFGWEVYSHGS